MWNEDIDQFNELCSRIKRFEELIDHCLDDIAECRNRIDDLESQRIELANKILRTANEIYCGRYREPDQPPVSAGAHEAPPVSIRESIRRSVCSQPGDYKAIAERLGIAPKMVTSPLSKLLASGEISKRGIVYGPPGGWDAEIVGTA